MMTWRPLSLPGQLGLLLGLVGLAGLTASSAWATVGDGQEQLFQRYGKGKQLGGNVLLYKVRKDDQDSGISVSIYFSGNTSTMEVFSRGHDAQGKRLPLNEEDIKFILEQNADGNRWQSYHAKRSGRDMWRRSDGRVMAHYDPAEMALTMISPEGSLNVPPSQIRGN